MRVKLLIILAFVVFLPLPPQALALALSDVELQSHLNQRLAARIMLRDVPGGEVEDLNISVSELADTVAAGRQTVLSYEVVAEGSNYYLMKSSRDAIREPY